MKRSVWAEKVSVNLKPNGGTFVLRKYPRFYDLLPIRKPFLRYFVIPSKYKLRESL
jgi:hypothetical protein